MRTYFPPSSCHLLPINSSGGGAAADGIPPPDIWAAHVSEPLFPPVVQGGALPPGGHAAALLSAAVVPELRGCCLSAGDHRALSETLSRVLAAGVLPEAERRLAKLTAAALQARRTRREDPCFPPLTPGTRDSTATPPSPPPLRRGVASATWCGLGGAAAGAPEAAVALVARATAAVVPQAASRPSPCLSARRSLEAAVGGQLWLGLRGPPVAGRHQTTALRRRS